MDGLRRLLAIEEIRALKARYFRCVDLKDWAGLAGVFAEDAELDFSDDVPGAVIRGRDQIVATVRESLGDAVTVHHGHCPELELSSPTTARGIWAMEDRLRWPATAEAPARTLHGFGHYYEAYERLAEGWRIRTAKLKRLTVEVSSS